MLSNQHHAVMRVTALFMQEKNIRLRHVLLVRMLLVGILQLYIQLYIIKTSAVYINQFISYCFEIFLCIIIASPYFLGIRGNKLHGCKNSTIHQDGKDILNKAKCQVACNALGIPIGKLKDEKLCYVGGDGKCRQTGTPGSGATLVCHKNGNGSAFNHINIFIYAYLLRFLH